MNQVIEGINDVWDTTKEEKRFVGICIEYFSQGAKSTEKLFEVLGSGVDETWFTDEKNKSLFLGIFSASVHLGQDDRVVKRSAIIEYAEKDYGEIGWANKHAEKCLEAVTVLEHREFLENEIPTWHTKLKKPRLNFLLSKVDNLLSRLTPGSSFVSDVENLLETAHSEWTSLPLAANANENSFDKLREKLLKPRPESATISTGLNVLNYILGGGFAGKDSLEEGKLITLMARPGQGKTLLAATLAMRVAMSGSKIGFWSFEMGSDQLMMRIIAAYDFDRLRKNNALDCEPLTYDRLRTQTLDEELSARLRQHEYSALGDNFSIFKGGDQDVHALSRHMRVLAKRDPDIRLFIIDHIGLVKSDQDVNGIGEITRTLKLTATDLGVDILALCQLNRGVEARTDKRPMMSDARGSGKIEEDSDVVIGLYRPSYYDVGEDPNAMEILVLKNRQGASGTFPARVSLDCCNVHDF
jgi:hypothetical protein